MIIQRLFIAADCDPVRTEYGIVCLDEVDKLQVRRGTNGRDVGGEGVQQALLKILEGTTVTVTAKSEPRNNQRNATSFVGGFGGNGAISGSSSAGKPETYQIRTDNILFICTGAFVGLQKIILDRISKGSIGFGAPVRALSSDSQATLSSAERSLYFKNLPFYSEVSATSANDEKDQDEEGYNPLDLVEPNDLQKYGLIPEFLGRIPTITALAPLSVASLARVLTEPRNSIIAQYTHLFHLFNVELRFTSLAIQEIAKSAHKLGTGARGVRTAVDRLLGESMYYSPGSSVRYVLVTGKAARREEGLGYWARGQATKFHAAIAAEEEEWEAIQSKQTKKEDSEVASFEEFREKAESGM
jgi:ATP-dependent Clp protease ATP-binding subunit ClpX